MRGGELGRSGLRTRCVLNTLAVTFFVARPAWGADDPKWMLDYDAPTECPNRAQARDLVVARLGFDPFIEQGNAPSTLRMTVTPAGSDLRVRVDRLENGTSVGERVLTDARGNCTELVASAAFAASLLVDPTGALRRPHEKVEKPDRDVASRDVDERAQPARARNEPPSPQAKASEPVHLLFGGGVTGGVGLSPSVSFGVRAFAGIELSRFSLRVEGRTDLPTRSDSLADGTGASSSVLLGALVPCLASGIARLCLVGAAGAIRAESTNLTPKEHDSSWFAAAGARAGVEIPLGRSVSGAAHLEGLIPLRSVTIRTRGIDVWTTPSVAASLGAGLVVRLF